jgi:hypothetical protein
MSPPAIPKIPIPKIFTFLGGKKRADKKVIKSSAIPDGTNQINTVMSNETGRNPISQFNSAHKRGLQVYTLSQIISASGRGEDGSMLTWGVEQPYFFLTAQQRNEITKLSTPVFGVVSSRMNKISGIDFNIVPAKKIEDRVANEMKSLKQIFDEYKNATDLKYLTIKAQIVQKLSHELPDVLPDLSNFNGCLTRWKKRIMSVQSSTGEEIKEWMQEPNNGTTWTSYVKKVFYNLLIHGCEGTYKQYETDKRGLKRLENFDSLTGGTIYRFKSAYFSGTDGYVQMVAGFEPQIFFANELMFIPYLPVSVQNYPMVPLEALVNKVAEGLLFDRLMAEQADGTKPPEKLAIVTEGNQNPFSDFDKPESMPINPDEQRRIEMKINEPRRGAIMTFAGNDVKVVDLSRENTMAIQNERQKDIREDVALVFNMSNMEVNLTGSGETGGRSTSESQAEIEQGKGITPLLKIIEESMSKDIIPFRYGFGWKMEYQKSQNDLQAQQIIQLMLANGEITINENREKKGLPTFDNPQFDNPMIAGANGQQQTGSNPATPQYMKQV